MSAFTDLVQKVIEGNRAFGASSASPVTASSVTTAVNTASSASESLYRDKEENNGTLRVGDLISLYIEDPMDSSKVGFLSVNGIVDSRCGINDVKPTNVPNNFRECIFMVHNVNQYSATKQYHKALEETELKEINMMKMEAQPKILTGIASVLSGTGKNVKHGASAKPTHEEAKRVRLEQLQKKMVQEKVNNKLEAERALGREVLYGQSIQLLHLKSNKFLTVLRESAELQKDCMRLGLTEGGNTASYFHIMPYYRFKREGERIRLGDQVRIFSRKFNQFLNISKTERYQDDPYERREVNMTTSMDASSTRWRMLLYSNFINVKDSRTFLKAGDCIRIFHKELEGYLTVEEDASQREFDLLQSLLGNKRYKRGAETSSYLKTHHETNRVKILSGSNEPEEMKRLSQTVWEVEMADGSRGGIISWNYDYRLKHVASGKYLAAVPQVEIDESIDDDLTDEEDESTVAPLIDLMDSPATAGSPPKDHFATALATSSSSKPGATGSSSPSVSIPPIETSSLKRTPSKSILKGPATEKEKEKPKEKKKNINFSKKQISNRWRLLKKALIGDKIPPTTPIEPVDITEVESVTTASSNGGDCDLVVTDSTGPETIFTIMSPQNLHTINGLVSYDSPIRILHKQTKSWIHGVTTTLTRSDTSNSLKKIKTEALENGSAIDIFTYDDVEVNPAPFEQDVFSVLPLSKEDMDNLNFVQSIIPSLLAFIGKISKKQPLKSSDTLSVIKCFTELIIFCTRSTEMDPFKREGIPYPNRQKILRERRVIDLTMNILTLPFQKNYIKLSKIQNAEYKTYQKLFRLGYRLIMQICNSNNKNGLYMSKYINDIQNHLDHGMGAEEALLAILKDNFELLNRITFEQVKFFVDLLINRKADNSRYLQFLSALCCCEDKPVVKNQDFIISLLMGGESKANLLIPTMEKGIVFVQVDTQILDMVFFTNLAQEGEEEYEQKLDFLENTMYLFARLCLGRNAKALPEIQQMLSLELILSCIMNEELPPSLRSSFCDLLLCAYIDVHPYNRRSLLQLTRKWAEVDVISEVKVTEFKPLKSFLKRYFLKNKSMDISHVPQNKFMLVLVRLAKSLFEFGLYREVRDISSILDPLFGVLEGKTDVYHGNQMNSVMRYKETEANIVVTRVKLEILKVFSLIMDIRTNRRISKFLNYYKHQYEHEESMRQNCTASDGEQESKVIRELFNDFKFGSKLALLDEVLLDLTQYENFELATNALQLLFRCQSQREELGSKLQDVELLVSPAMVRSYDHLNQMLIKLNQLLKSRLDEAELEQVLKIIQECTDDIKKHGNRSQRLLRNLGAHVMALQQLKSPLPSKEAQNLVYTAFIKFLAEFVRNNAENQSVLFDYVETLITLMTVHRVDTVHLLVEIVRNNRALVSILDEKDIKLFIDMIAENGHHAHYLNFLRAIVMVEGKPVMRNQTIVTKSLMDRQKDVIVLFTDEEGLKERNKLIKRKDHIVNPNGKLNYHINMLNLLCDCAEGKNHVSEVKLQSLLSIEQLVDQLLNSLTISALRDPLMKFLDEVYINTEKQSVRVNDCEKLWILFMKFNQELGMYLDEDVKMGNITISRTGSAVVKPARTSSVMQSPKRKPTSARKHDSVANINIDDITVAVTEEKVITLTPPAATEDKGQAPEAPPQIQGQGRDETEEEGGENETHEEEENPFDDYDLIDSFYVYKLLIPFIQHFFQRHFQNENVTSDKRDLIEEIVHRLIKLYVKTANPMQRDIIKKCMEALNNTMLSESTISLVKEFLKKVQGTLKIKIHHVPKSSVVRDESDEIICSNYATYVKKVDTKLKEDSTFHKVAEEYGKKDHASLSLRNTLLNIVKKIHNRGYTTESAHITLQALRTLRTLAENVSIQLELARSGAADLVIQLCTSSHHDIVESALNFGILLLSEGNKEVQSIIYEIFKNTRSESFFIAIRDRIRRAVVEIKERKYFEKQKKEKLQAIYEVGRSRKKYAGAAATGFTSGAGEAPMDAKAKNLEAQALAQEIMAEQFVETGHIKVILRFLQLLCEGHNLKLQDYLRYQEFSNSVSVNLIQECLNYCIQLHKYLDQTNVEIAIQCFETLTEFIQGPCVGNQKSLALSKLFFMANELLSEQYDDRLRHQHSLELKYKVLICLISLTEGSECIQAISELMRGSLSMHLLVDNMIKIHKILEGSNQQVSDSLRRRALEETNNRQLYTTDEAVSIDIGEIVENSRELLETVGIHYHILLNILKDTEKFLPQQNQKVTKLLQEKISESQTTLERFEKATGKIEVMRENQIERVYFRTPEICSLLSVKTKKEFENDCPRNSSQEKVQELFEKTNKFRIEIEHYASGMNLSSSGKKIWGFVQNQWQSLQFVIFIVSVIINLVVLLSYKKTIDPDGGNIPIPGVTTFDDVIAESNGMKMAHTVKVWELSIFMFVLGVLQLILLTSMIAIYIRFYSMLHIKLQFDLGKRQRWEEYKRDYKFYLRFIRGILTDGQFWFRIIYFITSIVALFITPLLYCVHLFEIIDRFSTLRNVLRAVTSNIKTLLLTFFLLIISLFLFSNVAFYFFYEEFTLTDNGQKLCDNSFQCFTSILNYGLRGGGFWEDIADPTLRWEKIIFDLAFNFINIIILVNMVFGMILESFARLREEKENTEKLKNTKCFICDIEKSRFDVKANEGISFEKHTKEEHYLWNYVNFLIYIYKKEKTEYTGTEQYIADLANKDDLSFFPILRSAVLEDAEQKEKNSQTQHKQKTV